MRIGIYDKEIEFLKKIYGGGSPGFQDVVIASIIQRYEKAKEELAAWPDAIERARNEHGSDEIEIDSDAVLSVGDEGIWVQGWVWIPKPPPFKVGDVVKGLVKAVGGTGETDEEVELEPGWLGVVDAVPDGGTLNTPYEVRVFCPGRANGDSAIIQCYDEDKVETSIEKVDEPSPFGAEVATS